MTQLAAANLLYRRPDLYDELATPDTDTILNLVDTYCVTPARSALDLGSGTGKLLSSLPKRFTVRVGIDLQPGMVEYTTTRHPWLDIRQSDICTLRLGRTFDVITCIGNTLAYLHSEEDLHSAMATIAAHAQQNTVVVVQTLTDPPNIDVPLSQHAELGGQTVKVTIGYEWTDPPMLTMHRHWAFPDGEVAEDRLHRRVWLRHELCAGLIEVGLTPVPAIRGYLVSVR